MAGPWYLFAFGAAVAWGINYALTEKILQGGVSMFFLMIVNSALMLFMTLAYGLTYGKETILKSSVESVSSGRVPLWMIILYLVSVFAGVCCVNYAIYLKNATTVSIFELCYPLFTIFFTWILFKDVHLTGPTLAGGALIMAGSALLFVKG